MKMKTANVGVAMLVAMVWMQDVHAQRSPWWERQKAGQVATGTEARSESVSQSDVAQPVVPPPQAHAAPVAREKIEGPSYTYVEAGAALMDVEMYGLDESGNGGYARGSVAVTDNLYVFGGYDRASESWSLDAEHLKVVIDQAELGLGTKISISSRADFISELSLLRLGGELDYRDADYPEDGFSGSDHLYAGKLMLGFRGRPVSNLELWAKAGYLYVDDSWLIDDSVVGNLGIQYRFTPAWGLVGEAEFYEDVRFYRLGIRASF